MSASSTRAPCVTCAAEGGTIGPHSAQFEVRDSRDTLLSYTCERGIAAVLARVLIAVLVLLCALACSSSSGGGSHDAGELQRRDGGGIAHLFDSGAAADAGEDLEHDAGADAGEDLEHDAGADAGEDLEHDAGADAGEDLEHDAGADAGELELPSSCSTDMALCRNAVCPAVCLEGFSYVCCELTPAAECRCDR